MLLTFPPLGHAGPNAERTRATPVGWYSPPAGQSPQFKFYFHLDKRRENNRQPERAAQPCPQARDRLAAGRWLFPSWLLRTACQTDALARTEPQSHAAGTGPIAIEQVKNNAPQHAWAFPISPAALLPAALAPASPRRFCRPRSSASSFLLLSPHHAAPQAPAPELSPLPPSRLLAAAPPPPSRAPQAAPGLPSLHSPWLSSAASWRTSASLPFPHVHGLPRAPRCLPPRSRLGQLRDTYTDISIYICTHVCASLSVSVSCLYRPRVQTSLERQRASNMAPKQDREADRRDKLWLLPLGD